MTQYKFTFPTVAKQTDGSNSLSAGNKYETFIFTPKNWRGTDEFLETADRGAHPEQIKIKRHKLCRYGDVERVAQFALQPKSTAEIILWLVQVNFEK